MKNLNFTKRTEDLSIKDLRKNGVIPGVVCGADIKSLQIQMNKRHLSDITTSNGEIFKISTKEGNFFTKFNNIQRDPVTREFIHFSLVAVNKDDETEVDIPISFIGEPEGLKEGGSLLTVQEKVTIKGKPSKIPKTLSIDISGLKVGENLSVSELKIPKGIELLSERDSILVVCSPNTKLDETETELTSKERIAS